MPLSVASVLSLLATVRADLAGDVSLASLARRARRSPSELHRTFRRVTGETTKGFTMRVRLEHAAAQLVLGERSVLDIALDCGFASHEVFTRAFRREFGITPSAYRARGLARAASSTGAAPDAQRHAAVVHAVGSCVALHHLSLDRPVPPMQGAPAMTVTVSRKQLTPCPALVIRRQTSAADIAKTLSEILPRVFGHAVKQGIALAGPPFTRYVEMGLGLLTIEAGMAIAAPSKGEGDIVAVELPGGPAASAIHLGPYDQLPRTHAEVERWIADHGAKRAGAPWEVYITDPGDVPNPAEWQTEVVYPLSS